MPDYKRKKRSRFSAKPKADKSKFAVKGEKKNIIEFDDGTSTQKRKRSFNILKGNKDEIKKRWQRTAIAVLVVILAAIICELSIPAGIIESVSTLVYSIGSGNDPITFDSTNTENVVSKGNFYYVLTDSEVVAVTKGGKVVLAITTALKILFLKPQKHVHWFSTKAVPTQLFLSLTA